MVKKQRDKLAKENKQLKSEMKGLDHVSLCLLLCLVNSMWLFVVAKLLKMVVAQSFQRVRIRERIGLNYLYSVTQVWPVPYIMLVSLCCRVSLKR